MDFTSHQLDFQATNRKAVIGNAVLCALKEKYCKIVLVETVFICPTGRPIRQRK